MLVAVSALGPGAKLAVLDAVTFGDQRGTWYMPIREVSANLDWPIKRDAKGLTLHGVPVPAKALRWLTDGSRLVQVGWLRQAGAIINPNKSTGLMTVKDAKRVGKAFYVRKGMKRVFINKRTQELAAYQGQRKVLSTRVSTGRKGQETPTGIFESKGKEKMHLSKLYHNVPMPWAVHVVGNVFIHGFKPSSGHSSSGCIRLPVAGRNPARWFYYWIERGTPVTMLGKWPKGAR
ncbi:MAG: L,D-transpeptidase [Fimbriimonas sp.]